MRRPLVLMIGVFGLVGCGPTFSSDFKGQLHETKVCEDPSMNREADFERVLYLHHDYDRFSLNECNNGLLGRTIVTGPVEVKDDVATVLPATEDSAYSVREGRFELTEDGVIVRFVVLDHISSCTTEYTGELKATHEFDE